MKTELGRNLNGWYTVIVKFIMQTLFQTDAISGSQTTLYCALQKGIENLSGRYFSDCEVLDVKPEAKDDEIARKLWDVSEKLCNLT